MEHYSISLTGCYRRLSLMLYVRRRVNHYLPRFRFSSRTISELKVAPLFFLSFCSSDKSRKQRFVLVNLLVVESRKSIGRKHRAVTRVFNRPPCLSSANERRINSRPLTRVGATRSDFVALLFSLRVCPRREIRKKVRESEEVKGNSSERERERASNSPRRK